MKLIYVFILLNLSCSKINQNEGSTVKSDFILLNEKKLTQKKDLISEKADSCILKKQVNISSQLFTLDDDGVLNIDSLGIQIKLSETKDYTYNLSVSKKGVSVFSKKNIEGISKIVVTQNFIMFSVYTTFTDDGKNEGYAVVYDFIKNKVSANKKLLSNTCNPSYSQGYFYLVEDLKILKTDLNFKPLQTIDIVYEDKKKQNEYLDTFLICGIYMSQNDFQISFTPQRNQSCVEYKGTLTEHFQKIILMD